MKEYVITKVNGAPDWSRIPALQVDHANWLPAADISTQAQICYDENGIYVHMWSREANIRAEVKTPLGMVCDDSCMEFFFRPDENDGRYFNIEMNPLGFTYLGICYNRHQACRLTPLNEDELMQKKTGRTADGWEVFYTVPLSFMQVFFPGYRLISGRKIYANCYKCGEQTVQSHFHSWNPCTSVTPDFHQPSDFGLMVLE